MRHQARRPSQGQVGDPVSDVRSNKADVGPTIAVWMGMSAQTRLKVAVVGCGIAGPAAALFLARDGHEVVVFDRAEELGPKGAGILLAPTGQYVLAKLGLLDAAVLSGSKIERVAGYTAKGSQVLDIRYRHFDPETFGLGIHRGALFTILYRAMLAQGIEIRTGCHVTAIEDGLLTYAPVGLPERMEPFDLVVVGDGARSGLRGNLGFRTHMRPYPYGAVWASVTNWGDYPDNVLRQAYSGTHRMIGLLPSGKLEGREGRQISVFWSLPVSQLSLWRVNGLDRWREDCEALLPGLESLLSEIESPEQVTFATYYDVRTWFSGHDHCAVIGDAGHASSLQLGQGASLALFDAMILAECIDREVNLLAALSRFAELRRGHLRFYRLASRWMTPLFQSRHGYLAPTRNLLLRAAARLPWLRREMAATMCGVKDGPFSRIDAYQIGDFSQVPRS